MDKQIIWLHLDPPLAPGLLGGKGLGLAQLARLGLLIPHGFVVTTAVFSQLFRSSNWSEISSKLAGLRSDMPLKNIEKETADIRKRLMDLSKSRISWEPLTTAYDMLGEKLQISDPVIAVRSSATGEDSSSNSFAGLYTSILAVRGKSALIQAITETWASLYSPAAIAYCLKNKLEMRAQMAVVVQQLLNARISGVMMTLDPLTGDRSKIVIEAIWGLGTLLVTNQVNPDRFLIDKITGEVIEQKISSKLVQQSPAPSTNEGTKIINVPPSQQQLPTLSAANISSLCTIGKQIENHFGTAQDIEFAFQENILFLLQSRPETVWNRNRVKYLGLPAEPIKQIIALMLRGGKNHDTSKL